MTLPAASIAWDEKWITSPVRAFDDLGSMLTDLLGFAVTSTAIFAVACSHIAVMFALPAFNPMIIPAASTEATDGLSEFQEILTSALGLPLEVRAVAMGRIAPPTTTWFFVCRSMLVTGAGLTLIFTVPTLPATTTPI